MSPIVNCLVIFSAKPSMVDRIGGNSAQITVMSLIYILNKAVKDRRICNISCSDITKCSNLSITVSPEKEKLIYFGISRRFSTKESINSIINCNKAAEFLAFNNRSRVEKSLCSLAQESIQNISVAMGKACPLSHSEVLLPQSQIEQRYKIYHALEALKINEPTMQKHLREIIF